jgi:hypothetical protein
MAYFVALLEESVTGKSVLLAKQPELLMAGNAPNVMDMDGYLFATCFNS